VIPGRALHRFASAFCSPDMRERVIDAFVADFQREWFDAATFRRPASVMVRGYASFGVALVACLAHDAHNDFAGFTTRVLDRVAFPTVMLGLLLLGLSAPSWVKTGRVDWAETLRGMGWMSSLVASIFVGRYRLRRAESRSLAAFFLAVGLAVAVVIVQRINPDHQTAYQWVFHASLNMSWPFLVRKQPDRGPVDLRQGHGGQEAGHYR
jgi:hypothetical protein